LFIDLSCCVEWLVEIDQYQRIAAKKRGEKTAKTYRFIEIVVSLALRVVSLRLFDVVEEEEDNDVAVIVMSAWLVSQFN
jgi:hypothetical protein